MKTLSWFLRSSKLEKMTNSLRIFTLICVSFLPLSLQANFGSLIKSALRNESKVIVESARETKILLRNSDEFVKGALVPATKDLRTSKSLGKGVRQNIRQFSKKRGQDILEFAGEAASYIADPEIDLDLGNRPLKYFVEMERNISYESLYKYLCEKIKVDSLSRSSQYLILNGAVCNGNRIAEDKLYNFYFIFSKSFAKEELMKLKKYYGCNIKKHQEIDLLAKRMRLSLPQTNCKNEERGDWYYGILGLLFFTAFGYFGYRLFRYVYRCFMRM